MPYFVEASPRDADQATDEEPVTLHTLRMDPGQVGVETELKEVAKLRQIRALGLPKDLFSHLSPKVLRFYRQRASAEAPSHLRAHPDQIRFTLLAALCWLTFLLSIWTLFFLTEYEESDTYQASYSFCNGHRPHNA
jgi:hypothetical protein